MAARISGSRTAFQRVPFGKSFEVSAASFSARAASPHIASARAGRPRRSDGGSGKGRELTFLGFEYRRIRSRNRTWRPNYAPKLKKRTALFAKLREIFRRYASQPVERVIELINPSCRGWDYCAVGHSSRCFTAVKDWVEKKIRRHLMRAQKRKGFGWKRWSKEWIYDHLGLFNNYRVRRSVPKAAPAR